LKCLNECLYKKTIPHQVSGVLVKIINVQLINLKFEKCQSIFKVLWIFYLNGFKLG